MTSVPVARRFVAIAAADLPSRRRVPAGSDSTSALSRRNSARVFPPRSSALPATKWTLTSSPSAAIVRAAGAIGVPGRPRPVAPPGSCSRAKPESRRSWMRRETVARPSPVAEARAVRVGGASAA